MTRITRLLCSLLALVGLSLVATAEPSTDGRSTTDKSTYNFLNPTPVELLRDLSVDGPGATESPYTVDAGHFQIEMEFVDYTSVHQTFEGVDFRLDWLVVAPMTLKVGLLNSLDLQLMLEPYNHYYQRESDLPPLSGNGFGDTTVRLKYNLWGNDSGTTALALTPFVRVPTSQDGTGSDILEGGLTVPFAARLPWKFHLGLMTRFTMAQDILGGKGRHEEFANSILLAHSLGNRSLEGYVEFFSNVSTETDVGWVGRFDTGLQWWLTDDLQLNGGVNIGLTQWADNWNFFAGFAWRY